MSRLAVTDFSKRTGSPFQIRPIPEAESPSIVHEEVFEKLYEKEKEKQNELLQKVNKKTAEMQSNKLSDGFFTEVVTHGAFTSKNNNNNGQTKPVTSKPTANGNAVKISLLGFPSSANDLALDAKSDLESDPNISAEVKEKVIEKLFALASIAQHIYESKVRVMTEFEKFRSLQLKTEARREKEYSEQLYKLNMNYQTEVVQAIQQLKSELDISRIVANSVDDKDRQSKSDPIEFNTSEDSKVPEDNIENNLDKGTFDDNCNLVK